jgi:hypothetical protein
MINKRPSQESMGESSPSEKFLDQTIEAWQPCSKRELTREDAREIAANLAGFFHVLREWDREDRVLRSSPKQNPQSTMAPQRTQNTVFAMNGSSPVRVEICPIENKRKFF